MEEVKEGFVEVDWGDCWTLLLLAGLGINFFLLPNKTYWALVYCPETLCLHSEAVKRNWICGLGREFMGLGQLKNQVRYSEHDT